ncbi:hypothetical protein ACVGXT_21040, partial [Enterobacter intestinihominis]
MFLGLFFFYKKMVLFFFGFKISVIKTKNEMVFGFFCVGPLGGGVRGGVRPPDRTTLPAFTPGGAALTG